MEQRHHMPRILPFFLPPLLVLLLVLVREHLAHAASRFPACPINSLFGILCPGCGMTRSILSILNGDFSASVVYHAAPAAVLVIGILIYLEMAFSALGRKLTLIPKKMVTVYVLLGTFFVYLLLRNLIP